MDRRYVYHISFFVFLKTVKDEDFMDSKLYHYGVKGMRWGVRRTPEQLGHCCKQRKLKKGQKAYDRNSKKNEYKVYNKAGEYSNEFIIPKLNKNGKIIMMILDISRSMKSCLERLMLKSG